MDTLNEAVQDLHLEYDFKKIGLRIGELACELQEEVFAHLSKAELGPWVLQHSTHVAAREQLWNKVDIAKILGVPSVVHNGFVHPDDLDRELDKGTRVMQFCDFVCSSAGEHIRRSIRELKLTIPEPWRQHPQKLREHRITRSEAAQRRCWYEKSWDAGKLEATLSLLTGLKSLKVHTHRPRRTGEDESFTETVAHRIISLPTHIKELHISETTEETFWQQDSGGSTHIGLFSAGSGLRYLSYTSNMVPHDDIDGTRNEFGSADGLDRMHIFSDVTELRLHIGDDIITTDPSENILHSPRLLRNLQSLHALKVLELWTYPYGPSQYSPYHCKEVFTQNWPALLPNLEVFRCPLRNFVEYLSKTSSEHSISFEVIVDKKEMRNPEIWKDANLVHVLFKLAEECAHFLDGHPDDKRRFSLYSIEVSEEHRLVYYAANRDVTQGLFGGSVPDNDWRRGDHKFFQTFMQPLIVSMPGFAEDREPVLEADEDSRKMFEKIAAWKPRGNLRIGWANTEKCKDGVWSDWETMSDDGDREEWLGEFFRTWHWEDEDEEFQREFLREVEERRRQREIFADVEE